MCILLLSGSLAAQEAATIGTVVDAEGRPLAAATVTFATSAPDVFDACAPARVVEVVTDEAGRFRVALRQGCDHSVWAIGPEDGAGRWRSTVQEGVIAGSVVELVATERSEPVPLVVAVPPELGPGPFTIESWLPARHAPAARTPLGLDGVANLPEGPLGGTMCRLLAADGRIVVGSFWANGERTAIGEVRRCTVEVVDEAGEPVVGARVAALVSATLHGGGFLLRARRIDSRIEGPPTDARGRSVMTVALNYLQGFVAWTPERHARLARRWPQQIHDGVPQAYTPDLPADDVPIRLIARRGAVLRGRLHRGDEPLAARRVVACVTGSCRRVERGFSHSSGFHASHAAVTDEDGRFVIPGVARPLAMLRLSFAADDGVATFALPRTEVPEVPIDLDLATWPRTALRLRTDAAMPPAESRFLLWPTTDTAGDPLVLVGDRSGQVQARLEPGAWFVFATDGDGFAAEVVTVRAGADATVPLPLTPLASMSGRVVDAAGEPVPNVRFTCNGSRSHGRPERGLVTRLLQQHHGAFQSDLVGRAVSDAEGRFCVRFVPIPDCVTAGLVFGAAGHTNCEYELREDLEIVLPPATRGR